MLTRDFTCSRNLSQEFVAVVIARETLTPLFSTDGNKLWKAGPFIFVFQASGVMPVSGASCFPLAPRARPSGKCRPLAPPLSDSAGLSPIGPHGASEKCAKGLTVVHIPCTVFPQAQLMSTNLGDRPFAREFSRNFRRTHATLHRF